MLREFTQPSVPNVLITDSFGSAFNRLLVFTLAENKIY
jgi:hypothetical protein